MAIKGVWPENFSIVGKPGISYSLLDSYSENNTAPGLSLRGRQSCATSRRRVISYAQNLEDVVLRRVFRWQSRGFYVDIGAFDPNFHSVTKHFYDHGWRGVNVEPVAACHRRFLRERRRDISLRLAIGEQAGTAELHEWTGTGLSTMQPTAVRELEEQGYRWRQRAVPMVTLAELLDHVSVSTIDFLKIDVEGLEEQVIRGGDWKRHRPRVLVIEAIRPIHPGDDPVEYVPTWEAWEPLLFEHGYRFALFDGLNRFYYCEEEPELARQLCVPANVRDQYEIARLEEPTRTEGDSSLPVAETNQSAGQRGVERFLWWPMLRADNEGVPSPTPMTPRKRIEMTVACRDCDSIEKVPAAGEVLMQDGVAVQVMHEGTRVRAGGYHGDWMLEVIKRLQGHHEPQEERLFDEIVRHCRSESLIVELGAHWAYYANWYLGAIPGSRGVCVEPDESNLALAAENLALNGRKAELIHACVGGTTGQTTLHAETLRRDVTVDCLDMGGLLARIGRQPIEVLHMDVQGAENDFLRSMRSAGVVDGERPLVRFLVVSTHHATISGSPDTHRECLEAIEDLGGFVLAEHAVEESFSGDGLIVASFLLGDAMLPLPEISRNKPERSLFGRSARAS